VQPLCLEHLSLNWKLLVKPVLQPIDLEATVQVRSSDNLQLNTFTKRLLSRVEIYGQTGKILGG